MDLIKLKLLAALKQYAPSLDEEGCFTVEYRPDITIADALGQTNISEANMRYTVLVNNVRKKPGDVLEDGDTVTVMALLAGG